MAVRSSPARTFLFLCAGLAAACTGGGGARPPAEARLILSAGMVPLAPLPEDTLSPAVDVARLGIEGVARAYDVSTPAGEPFSIQVLARAAGSAGPVRLRVAHCSDGGAQPVGGPESLGDAGILPAGNGAGVEGPWLEVAGDGYVRMGLSGGIDRDQVLAISAETGEESTAILLRIGVGEESIINRTGPDAPVEDHDPHVVQTATLYSSDLDMLAAPVVASAGGLTTAIFYDGNRADPEDWDTYEIRVRHDALTNSVAGGGATSLGDMEWFGEWRDHEVAARGDVLAVARASDERVTLRISFDGGATFAQTHTFASGYDDWSFRLAQVAIGPSHEIAILFWRVNPDYSNDLVLVEGAPSRRDAAGAPREYALGGERVLFHGGENAGPAFVSEDLDADFVPLVIGAQYSERGDLVVAYGYTGFVETPDDFTAFTETRCATRLAGTDAFRDARVELEDNVIGFDPSVSVLGGGSTMTIFVAYEASDGVRLRMSADGGRTFSEAAVSGGGGAHLPTVLARVQEGATRVDLLYVAQGEYGNELHVRHWDDFGAAPSHDYRLVAAGPEGEDAEGVPGEPGHVPGTYVERHLAWFGYDATLAGDDVVVACVEEIADYYRIFAIDGPVPAEPMPAADDACACVPPPDPLHLRVVRLIRLD